MKKIWKILDLSVIAFFAALVFCTVTLFYSRNLAIAGYVTSAVMLIGKFWYHKTKREKLLLRVRTVSDELDFERGKAFEKLSVACTVVEGDGSVIWLNDSFLTSFGISEKSKVNNIKQIIKTDDIEKLLIGYGYGLRVDDLYFAVYSNEIHLDDETIYLLYFFNETALRNTEREYYETRPSIMLTVVDNAEEVYQNFKESECTSIFSLIEKMIDDWASSYGGLCRKFSNARMLIFAEERSLQKMIDDKFSILEQIREFTYEGKSTDITLSIGVGKSDSLHDANNSARQALDMAQSRGGDQVAIKHDTEYKFYGGVSEGFEKKNKVRTRLIAKTMAEIISDSDNVLVMGHRFSDFDSFGSCVGMLGIAEHFSKEAHIVINEKTSLAAPLIKKFKEEKGAHKLLTPKEAFEHLKDNTLLIITDTHKQSFAESPELAERAGKVMVIDHHRKSVGFIEDTVMFYHMPNSSSASEMVTEIAQYVDKNPVIDRFEALALLSGIMLDTRNFIIRAGVRTFEAAAYLRSRGASTVEGKKLFSNDMDLFRHRNSIIDLAREYKKCAISKVTDEFENIRLVTSQAADEMLSIEGISASFVIFTYGNGVNISARSYGEINVQLIMENLGGGGHQTMSACQLSDVTAAEAERMLERAIDDYYSNL